MNEQLDKLFNRYAEKTKPLLVPFLVLYIIYKRGKASSIEIKKDLIEIAGKPIEYEYTSYYRMMGNLEHEFKVIEPVEFIKEKGPARVYYSLTPFGEVLMKKIYQEIILPLQKVELKSKEAKDVR